jgi:amidase
MTVEETSYEQRGAKKLARQASLIPPEWRLKSTPSVSSTPNALEYLRRTPNLLTPRELALTEVTDVNILLRRLSSGALSSLELTRTFAKRAALVHQLTTCYTEIFFDEAYARAKELDEYLATTGMTVGPLHGLPVSLKDLFGVQGVDTSIGTICAPSLYFLQR